MTRERRTPRMRCSRWRRVAGRAAQDAPTWSTCAICARLFAGTRTATRCVTWWAAVDAFVKVVVRDGTKLDSVVHFGRHIPAVLRTALELGDPERLDGLVCVEEGCDRRHDLELDHVDPLANDGPTNYENLQPRCKPHHWAKTERDRKAGKLGAAGRAPP